MIPVKGALRTGTRNRTHGDKTAHTTRIQHKGRIRGQMIPQTSLLIYQDEALEVEEDRATTLVLRRGPRVSHSAVEMERMYATMEIMEVLE